MTGSGYGWISNRFGDYKNLKKSENDSDLGRIEFIMKGVKIHSVVYDDEYDFIVVASSDNKLSII